MNAGYYNITFDARNLSTGLYIYRIVTDKNKSERKMFLLK
jgi:hypothetical protein